MSLSLAENNGRGILPASCAHGTTPRPGRPCHARSRKFSTFIPLIFAVLANVSPALLAATGAVRPGAPVSSPHNILLPPVESALQRTVKIYGGGIGTQHGYGTGIVVSPEGEIVTALNLVLEGSSLRVVASDGHIYGAEVLYRDDYRQLALIKKARHTDNLDTAAPLTDQMARAVFDPFPLGTSSSARAGDLIFVVGNPFKVAEGDEPLTVMKGVLSGRTRLSAARGTQPFPYMGDILLLDAITSGPGQAGSAVVDLEGRLIGIVGKSVTSRETNTLLNYALPVEEVAAFLKDARAGATTTRPTASWSGTGYHGISLSKIAYHRELPFVRSVVKGSPAEKAGVRADDLIVSANGTAISRGREFSELCDRLGAGEELSLIVKRGEQLIPIRFKMGEKPK